MTREEAIDILENEKMCVNNETCQREECATCSLVMDKDKILTALDMALIALRPVSREQVKRVWYRGHGWKYETAPSDNGGIVYHAINTCMYCGSETPIGNFCHRCGIAQTDMGVDVVMERLEALKDGKGD